MENVVSFMRINKNNSEYSMTQIEAIKAYVEENNIDLVDNIVAPN